MPTPSKAEQEAESRARADAGADPQLNAGALDVIDDAPRGDEGAPADRTAAPAADAPVKPTGPVKSAFDTKRADIVARFSKSRGEEADAARDDISDFARSGMPPEFEPAPAPVVEDQPVAEVVEKPDPVATPKTVRVKVRGQEIELSQEDLIAHAQKALAAENYLDEAKGKLKEVDTLLRETREKGPARGPTDQHQVRPNNAQPEAQPPATDEAVDPDTTEDDPLRKLIDSLQFGDPAEAKVLLQNTIAAETTKAVTGALQRDRLRDEGARSQKVLVDFLAQNAELAADPRARAVIEYNIYEQQLDDLKALGIDPDQIQTAHGGTPTPSDIAQAHRWYRAEGFNVRSPKVMLETASEGFKTWKGVKATEPAADPAEKVAPRVDLTVERQNRRQAVPQQPSRTVAPKPGAEQPAPQARDRSDIVASMRADRSLPRGKVAV